MAAICRHGPCRCVPRLVERLNRAYSPCWCQPQCHGCHGSGAPGLFAGPTQGVFDSPVPDSRYQKSDIILWYSTDILIYWDILDGCLLDSCPYQYQQLLGHCWFGQAIRRLRTSPQSHKVALEKISWCMLVQFQWYDSGAWSLSTIPTTCFHPNY